MSESVENAAGHGQRRRWIVLMPLVVFLGLAGLFLIQLLSGRDAATVPSALIGQNAPATSLPPLEGLDLPGLDTAALEGEVALVNVWASWCAPCRQEHPLLMELARDERLSIAGLNYKDRPDNARRFLGELGNPYHQIGADQNGRAAINWGVYGVPETFLVGRDGTILYKHIGPLSPRDLQEQLLPRIEQAIAQ